jgi:soluble lytic murein transglycosylase-like protein
MMLIELCLALALNVSHQRVAAAYHPIIYAADRHSVDPAVLFAIAKHESNFRPDAIGLSGDLGLFQINPRWHMHRFSNVDWRNPWANASVGAFILADNLRVTGTVRAALRRYVGGNYAVTKPSQRVRDYVDRVDASYFEARKCFQVDEKTMQRKQS